MAKKTSSDFETRRAAIQSFNIIREHYNPRDCNDVAEWASDDPNQAEIVEICRATERSQENAFNRAVLELQTLVVPEKRGDFARLTSNLFASRRLNSFLTSTDARSYIFENIESARYESPNLPPITWSQISRQENNPRSLRERWQLLTSETAPLNEPTPPSPTAITIQQGVSSTTYPMPTKKTTAKRTRRRTNAPALEAGTAILAGTNYSESQYAKFVLGVEDAKKGIYRLGRARDAGYLVGTSYPRGLNVFTYQFNPNRFVAEDQREYLRWVPEGEGPNEGHWEFVERSPTSGRWKKAMQTVRNIRVIPSETVIETWDMTT